MWSSYRVFGTQTGAFRERNVENSIRNFLLVQRLAFLIARSMGTIFRMLDIVATDPVQALFKSILTLLVLFLPSPFSKELQISSHKFSQILREPAPSLWTSHHIYVPFLFPGALSFSFYDPYHSDSVAETRAPHYSRASQVFLFQLSSSFFSSQLIHPLNQMIRQQEIRNPLLYNIFMPAIPTDHFPFHHLRF